MHAHSLIDITFEWFGTGLGPQTVANGILARSFGHKEQKEVADAVLRLQRITMKGTQILLAVPKEPNATLGYLCISLSRGTKDTIGSIFEIIPPAVHSLEARRMMIGHAEKRLMTRRNGEDRTTLTYIGINDWSATFDAEVKEVYESLGYEERGIGSGFYQKMPAFKK